jgi:hypothetical protein
MITSVWIRTPHEKLVQKVYPLADFPLSNVLDKAIVSKFADDPRATAANGEPTVIEREEIW